MKNYPADLKYTNDHEWIKVDGKNGIIGITDHAQGELGDVVYIDIADDLTNITVNETFGTIEAVKTVSDLLAPVSGKVVAINSSLNENPSTVNEDPYGEGWLIKIELTNPSDLDNLMDVKAYKELIGE